MRILRDFGSPLLLAATVSAAFAQSGLPGHWEGTLQVPNGPNVVALDLARDGQGAWIASLGIPQRQISGLLAAGVTVEGPKVKFTAPDVPGNPAFELSFAAGKLAGTVSVQGQSLPIEMHRTGEAKVEAAGPSAAVSKELEGDWEGTFALANGQTRPILVHFRNQTDRTVRATIDSPTQGVYGGELDRVVQDGGRVKFHVRIHGGSFEGTLNAAGIELTGAWIQGPPKPPVPLTFKKK